MNDTPPLLDEDSSLEALPEDTGESFNPDRKRWTTTVDALGPSEPPTVSGTMSLDAISLADLPPLEYEFVQLLGRGGLGEVWEAKQLSLGRSVAIKRLKSETYQKVSRNESVKTMLAQGMQAEAVTTAILDHPNIVPVHDFSRDHDGRPMISMKLVRGEPWDIILKRDIELLTTSDYLAKHIPILVDMAQAVAFAHSRGIIHRDLKPAQVMVGEFDEVLLMDWGLAVTYDEKRVASFGLTNYTSLMPTTETASNPAGTVAYMAPEQTDNAANYLGPWTDVYLLGATLYQVLTGKVPHPGTRIEAFRHAKSGRVFPVEVAAPSRQIPDELQSLLNASMEPDWRRRKMSATDFVNHLKAWLARRNERMEGLSLREKVHRSLRELNDESDYRDFTEMLVQLRRLQYLLPDDKGVEELESDLSARFALVASARGDLGLARLQAELIPDPRRRDVISVQVEREAKKLAVSDRQRRVFLTGFIVLAITACSMIAYFTSLVQSETRSRQTVEQRTEDLRRSERSFRLQADATLALALLEPSSSAPDYLREAATKIKFGFPNPDALSVEFQVSDKTRETPALEGGAGIFVLTQPTSRGQNLRIEARINRLAAGDKSDFSEQEKQFLYNASRIVALNYGRLNSEL
jgi:serine/threonine protein kinase